MLTQLASKEARDVTFTILFQALRHNGLEYLPLGLNHFPVVLPWELILWGTHTLHICVELVP